jgi:hypothetical protein
MKLSIKKESKEFEAVSVAFYRSLKSLEIEPARFRALPIKQRRLALCEAIYKTAKQVSTTILWYQDRSSLYSKKLWDFSPDEVTQHQIIVDALIALVCLGESAFVRPLVTYLSFPEPRWAILISSLLRAISTQGIRGPTFRLPSDEERAQWRKWAIEHVEFPAVRDYSYMLLSDIGSEEVNWNLDISEQEESALLRVRNEFFETDWKYYDEKQADYCDRFLYRSLKSYDYGAFADLLERFVSEHPQQGNFTTLVACMSDSINELHLSKSALKESWLDVLSDRKVSSRTGAILYQILVYPKTNRPLARSFGRKLFRDEIDLNTLASVADILMQSQSVDSIYRITKTLSIIDELPKQSRERFLDLIPTISMIFFLWVSNLSSRELESFCLLGSEEPNRRGALLESAIRNFQSNDNALVKFLVFEHSPNPDCQVFADQIKRFLEFRKPLERDLSAATPQTSELVLKYLDVVRVTFRRFLHFCNPGQD